MTLRHRFILALVSMVVFMAIISGIISLFSVNSLLDRSVKFIHDNNANRWNEFLVSYYEEKGNWQEIQADVGRMLEDPNQREWGLFREVVRIVIFDPDYNIVASLHRPEPGGKATRQSYGSSAIDNNFPEPEQSNLEEMKADAMPIQVANETVGYLWLDDNLTSRNDFLSRTLSSSIVKGMVSALIITSLVALVSGIFMSRRLTEPLRRLTEAVAKYGKKDLFTRIEPEGSTDIIALTEAFNLMIARIAHNEKVRSKMVADIAHELRTPLTVISGKLESIQEGVLPATPETILPIQDEVIRMTRLVRDLQHLSLAEAGKLPLDIKEVDLAKLINQILEHFAPALKEKEITVEVTGNSVPVQGDKDRFMQVFVNLIANAVRHSRTGKPFIIHFEPGSLEKRNVEKGVFISFQDSGEGIPEEDLAHIFDRFYRVDSARDRTSGGTGLGLAIAKEFIEAHGGQITVSSKVGEGSKFIVWLPEKCPAAKS